jgi:hypothetical protein
MFLATGISCFWLLAFVIWCDIGSENVSERLKIGAALYGTRALEVTHLLALGRRLNQCSSKYGVQLLSVVSRGQGRAHELPARLLASKRDLHQLLVHYLDDDHCGLLESLAALVALVETLLGDLPD